jgi:hypothetical protein
MGMESAVNAHRKPGYKNCIVASKIGLPKSIEKQKPADTWNAGFCHRFKRSKV